MKILFYGDSITDAGRTRDLDIPNKGLGGGYVTYIANQLFEKSLSDYDIYNTGISGNRIVDLYARIKIDCWNIKPDLLSILIGINDIWHEVKRQNGVEIDSSKLPLPVATGKEVFGNGEYTVKNGKIMVDLPPRETRFIMFEK